MGRCVCVCQGFSPVYLLTLLVDVCIARLLGRSSAYYRLETEMLLTKLIFSFYNNKPLMSFIPLATYHVPYAPTLDSYEIVCETTV
jgi:hypothetical protein